MEDNSMMILEHLDVLDCEGHDAYFGTRSELYEDSSQAAFRVLYELQWMENRFD